MEDLQPRRPLGPDDADCPVWPRWAVLVLSVLVLSWAGSAGLVAWGWDGWRALLLAGVVVVVVVAGYLREARARPWTTREWGFTALATLLVGGMAAWLLWIDAFRGMPALGGGDAGDHVALASAFMAQKAPGQHGMGAYYTLVHWVGLFGGLPPFGAARVVHYGSVVALVALTAALGTGLARCAPGLSSRRLLGLWATLALVATVPAVLPLLHYYQADGFLPQILGVVVLLGAAAGYVGAESLGWRAVTLFFALALLRYTHVLNATETVLTCAAVLAWELGATPSRKRRVAGLVILLGGVALAVLTWRRITLADGFMAGQSMVLDHAAATLAGLTALSLAALLVPWGYGAPCSEPTRRLARFVGLFGLLGVAVRGSWLLYFGHGFYYECKQSFAPVVVVTLGVTVLLAELIARRAGSLRRLSSLRRLGRRPGALGLLTILGLGLTTMGVAPYWPSFAERAFGRRPIELLTPLLDPGTATEIWRTLARQHQAFGGFLTPRWPESSFTNAAFGYPRRSWVEADAVRRRPGHCVFWYDPASLAPRWSYSRRHARTVAWLAGTRQAPCAHFAPADGMTETLTLCHRCFEAGWKPSVLRESFALTDEEVFHAGFHDVEVEAGRRWRWTNGDGRLKLKGLPTNGYVCALILNVRGPNPLEVWLGDQRLPGVEGGRYAMPRQAHEVVDFEVRLRSPTFSPGPVDPRDMGVQVFGAVMECLPP